MKEVRGSDIVAKMNALTYSRGKQVSEVFTDMLDAFIDFMSLERLQRHEFDIVALLTEIKDEPFFDIYQLWLEWVNQEQRKNGVVDAFDFYEDAVKSKGKADALGQFYTPMSLCKLMGDIVAPSDAPENDVEVILDCACGSSRTLLGHYQKAWTQDNICYYVAGDIDSQSVKMSAINMAINGMFGRCVCGDALALEYRFGYEINEVKYPIPTPYCSIRPLADMEGADSTQKYIYWTAVHDDTRAILEFACQTKRQIWEKNKKNANEPQETSVETQSKKSDTNIPKEGNEPKYGKYEQLTIF